MSGQFCPREPEQDLIETLELLRLSWISSDVWDDPRPILTLTFFCLPPLVRIPMGGSQLNNVFLLTLEETTRFYEKLGFVLVPPTDVPSILKLELVLGSLLQSFFGRRVVCMRASAG